MQRQAEAQHLREMQQLRQEERRVEAVAAKEAVESWEAGRLKEPSWDTWLTIGINGLNGLNGIGLYIQKGTPWECGFSLHSATTDTAHLIFATTASAMVLSLLCNHWQFLLGFSAMAKQNQNQKNKKTRNQNNKNAKNQKDQHDKTQLSATPPWSVQYIFLNEEHMVHVST